MTRALGKRYQRVWNSRPGVQSKKRKSRGGDRTEHQDKVPNRTGDKRRGGSARGQWGGGGVELCWRSTGEMRGMSGNEKVLNEPGLPMRKDIRARFTSGNENWADPASLKLKGSRRHWGYTEEKKEKRCSLVKEKRCPSTWPGN